jgi:hypothetical protein
MSNEAVLRSLQTIPNVGPRIAADLVQLGIRSVDDLADADPGNLYEQLCAENGRQDPCVADVFCAAVDFARGGPPRPWWEYSRERKAREGDRSKEGPSVG